METSGQRVSAALEQIKAYSRPLVERRDPEGLENLESFVAAGEDHRAGLVAIVHKKHPADFDVPSMRYWLRLAWEAEPGARLGAAGLRSADTAAH